ncbi:hypothetical protein H696_02375 [Fonticula alba]|uniref:Uncharacterized protein n=1 Tax=Fonticula alba TaxID=691883 RepID=A0A058ZDB3_FONAL|nr:hypothetical protein H696_02375 [Fonticula alba]KCV71427.1 hypothetical protein H696_02375 [Fonticula alba]|eukprot:XP_009494550.1 hypothetical protein H696_02375 [Fonticula alba]
MPQATSQPGYPGPAGFPPQHPQHAHSPPVPASSSMPGTFQPPAGPGALQYHASDMMPEVHHGGDMDYLTTGGASYHQGSRSGMHHHHHHHPQQQQQQPPLHYQPSQQQQQQQPSQHHYSQFHQQYPSHHHHPFRPADMHHSSGPGGPGGHEMGSAAEQGVAYYFQDTAGGPGPSSQLMSAGGLAQEGSSPATGPLPPAGQLDASGFHIPDTLVRERAFSTSALSSINVPSNTGQASGLGQQPPSFFSTPLHSTDVVTPPPGHSQLPVGGAGASPLMHKPGAGGAATTFRTPPTYASLHMGRGTGPGTGPQPHPRRSQSPFASGLGSNALRNQRKAQSENNLSAIGLEDARQQAMQQQQQQRVGQTSGAFPSYTNTGPSFSGMAPKAPTTTGHHGSLLAPPSGPVQSKAHSSSPDISLLFSLFSVLDESNGASGDSHTGLEGGPVAISGILPHPGGVLPSSKPLPSSAASGPGQSQSLDQLDAFGGGPGAGGSGYFATRQSQSHLARHSPAEGSPLQAPPGGGSYGGPIGAFGQSSSPSPAPGAGHMTSSASSLSNSSSSSTTSLAFAGSGAGPGYDGFPGGGSAPTVTSFDSMAGGHHPYHQSQVPTMPSSHPPFEGEYGDLEGGHPGSGPGAVFTRQLNDPKRTFPGAPGNQTTVPTDPSSAFPTSSRPNLHRRYSTSYLPSSSGGGAPLGPMNPEGHFDQGGFLAGGSSSSNGRLLDPASARHAAGRSYFPGADFQTQPRAGSNGFLQTGSFSELSHSDPIDSQYAAQQHSGQHYSSTGGVGYAGFPDQPSVEGDSSVPGYHASVPFDLAGAAPPGAGPRHVPAGQSHSASHSPRHFPSSGGMHPSQQPHPHHFHAQPQSQPQQQAPHHHQMQQPMLLHPQQQQQQQQQQPLHHAQFLSHSPAFEASSLLMDGLTSATVPGQHELLPAGEGGPDGGPDGGSSFRSRSGSVSQPMPPNDSSAMGDSTTGPSSASLPPSDKSSPGTGPVASPSGGLSSKRKAPAKSAARSSGSSPMSEPASPPAKGSPQSTPITKGNGTTEQRAAPAATSKRKATAPSAGTPSKADEMADSSADLLLSPTRPSSSSSQSDDMLLDEAGTGSGTEASAEEKAPASDTATTAAAAAAAAASSKSAPGTAGSKKPNRSAAWPQLSINLPASSKSLGNFMLLQPSGGLAPGGGLANGTSPSLASGIGTPSFLSQTPSDFSLMADLLPPMSPMGGPGARSTLLIPNSANLGGGGSSGILHHQHLHHLHLPGTGGVGGGGHSGLSTPSLLAGSGMGSGTGNLNSDTAAALPASPMDAQFFLNYSQPGGGLSSPGIVGSPMSGFGGVAMALSVGANSPGLMLSSGTGANGVHPPGTPSHLGMFAFSTGTGTGAAHLSSLSPGFHHHAVVGTGLDSVDMMETPGDFAEPAATS